MTVRVYKLKTSRMKRTQSNKYKRNMVIDLLNIASLVFGLIAWLFPVMNLLRKNKQAHLNWIVFSMVSLSACAVALCLQIAEIYYRVKIEDFSALMDIMGMLVVVSAILLIVTIVLNVLTLIIYRNRI